MTERRHKNAILTDIDTPAPRHFWLKWFGTWTLLAVEIFIITLLCYRLLGPRPHWAVFIFSIILAIVLDLSILKIYFKIKKHKKSC